MRGPLDSALRWVERLSLRGAIVLAGVESGVVRGNHVAEVGRSGDFAVPNVDGALVGGASLTAADFGAIIAAAGSGRFGS